MAFFKEALPDGVSCPECRRSLTDKNLNPGGRALADAGVRKINVILGREADFPYCSPDDSLTHAKVKVRGLTDQPEVGKLWSFHALISI